MNKCVRPTVRPSHVNNDPIAKGHMAGSLRGKPGRVSILQTWRARVRMPHLLTPEESDWRSSRRAAVEQANGRSSDSFVFRCLPVLLPNAAGDSKPTLAAFGHSGFASGAKIGTIKKNSQQRELLPTCTAFPLGVHSQPHKEKPAAGEPFDSKNTKNSWPDKKNSWPDKKNSWLDRKNSWLDRTET